MTNHTASNNSQQHRLRLCVCKNTERKLENEQKTTRKKIALSPFLDLAPAKRKSIIINKFNKYTYNMLAYRITDM